MSQICDHGHTCVFDSTECEIMNISTNKVVATTTRTPHNIYIIEKSIKSVATWEQKMRASSNIEDWDT